MSETQNLEIDFHEQVNDLCRCIKYLTIFNLKGQGRSFRRVKRVDDTLDRSIVTRDHSVCADTTGAPLIKDKLKLLPAVLDFTFIYEEKENEPTKISLPLSSDIIQSLTPGARYEVDAWYQLMGLQRFEVDPAIGVNQLKFEHKWQAYYPVESADSEGEFIYVHFPANDSWVAFRFRNVSDDTSVLQILNHTRSFIVSDYELRFRFNLDKTTFTAGSERDTYESEFNEELSEDKLFNMSKLYYEAEDQIESYKYEQEDPYIDAQFLEDEEITFICGSEEQLEQMLTTICHVAIPMPLWDKIGDLDIDVTSTMDDGDGASIDYDGMSYSNWGQISDQLAYIITDIENAFDAALAQNTPTGHSWEYNDGPSDRQSAYDKSPRRLTITVSSPSAHEQVGAKMEINKLAPVLGKDTIAGLLKQK